MIKAMIILLGAFCTISVSAQKLSGKVVDETGTPLPFANVVVVQERDSAFIQGTVSNNEGAFELSDNQSVKKLLKVSSVGYETLYLPCTTGNVGLVKMRQSSKVLNGVTVMGSRPQYRIANGGITIGIENTILSKVGTAIDVLNQLPRVSVGSAGDIQVFAKGAPLVYINNKLVRDNNDLQRLESDNIKSVEVITSPGAKYSASVQSVIRIKTKKPQDEGISFRSTANAVYNTKWGGYQQDYIKYRKRNLELFASGYVYTSAYMEKSDLTQEINSKTEKIDIKQYPDNVSRSWSVYGNVGFNYDINDSNSIGATYGIDKSLYDKSHAYGVRQRIWRNDVLEGDIIQNFDIDESAGPVHEANIYYTGKIGKLGIDLNGTYLWKKSTKLSLSTEQSDELEDRDINSSNAQRSNMIAGKLIFSYPVWQGSLDFGSEVTRSNSNSEYINKEEYVAPSKTKIEETNVAGFAEVKYPIGNLSLSAGLRFESVRSSYYEFDKLRDDMSRRYNNWFPSVSVSWSNKNWSWGLAYVCKTQRPSYNSLRSDVQYDNRYMYEGGNPSLQPVTKHNLELNAVYKWMSLSAGYSYLKDDILWVTTLYNDMAIGFLRNMNFDHTQNTYASLVVSPKFGWYQPNVEIDYMQNFFDAKDYGGGKNLNTPTFAFSLSNRFTIGKTTSMLLDFNYQTKSCSGFTESNESGGINFRLVETLLKNTLSVNLFVNDILKTQKVRWTMYGINTNLGKDANNYARKIGITVTYNFNSTRDKYKGTGAGNEEKNRL